MTLAQSPPESTTVLCSGQSKCICPGLSRCFLWRGGLERQIKYLKISWIYQDIHSFCQTELKPSIGIITAQGMCSQSHGQYWPLGKGLYHGFLSDNGSHILDTPQRLDQPPSSSGHERVWANGTPCQAQAQSVRIWASGGFEEERLLIFGYDYQKLLVLILFFFIHFFFILCWSWMSH